MRRSSYFAQIMLLCQLQAVCCPCVCSSCKAAGSITNTVVACMNGYVKDS